MSSLQWSLLIGAVALIAAVLLLNGLQQWKRRSRGEKTLEALREVVRSRKPLDQTMPVDSQGISQNKEPKQAPTSPRQNLPHDFFDPVVDGPRTIEEPSSIARPIAQAATVASSEPVKPLHVTRPERQLDHELAKHQVKEEEKGDASALENANQPSQAESRLVGTADQVRAEQGLEWPRAELSREAPSPAPLPVQIPESPSIEALPTRALEPASVTEEKASDAVIETIVEPVRELVASEALFDTKQWARSKPWVGIDERVDLLVGLESLQGWQGERLLQAFQGLRRVGTKPLLLEGQILSDPQQTWVPVVPGQRFVRLRLGLLLANRSGALKPTEYSDFLSALQSVRDLLQASWTDGAAPLGMHEALERARRVDVACAALDAQVVINLALGEAISTMSFSRMGMSLGLVDRGNTRQALLTGQGLELFSMTLGSKPDWMTFMLDVPRSPMVESPWQRMMDCAASAVGRFGGQLLDDHGQLLEAHQLAAIGKQVLERQQQLIDAGYPPGSALALRLFN
ncbi:MAG: hypothetical protein ACK4WE_07080 [Burkholderiales bacterium]